MSQYNILVLGPGMHRESGLASLRAAGHTVGVVDDLSCFLPELVDWWAPYPPSALENAADVIAGSGIEWDVALAWGELSLESSLGVADQLGLAHARLAVANFRDKARMRHSQRAAGLRVPDYAVVEDVASALELVRRFPVVVKPVDYGGSSGVRLVSSAPQLAEAVGRALTKSFVRRAIVEAVVDGPEYSVETVSFGDGVHHSYAVVAKTVTPPPFRVETGHDIPCGLPPDLIDAVVEEVHRTLDALGMQTGASHAEVKMSTDGPCVIEVGGRLAGDYIPQLVRLAHGVDLHLEELRAVLGGAAPVAPGRDAPMHTAAAMRVLQAPAGGYLRWPDGDVVRGTALDGALRGLHHWYPDNVRVPVIDSSARRLGACVLAGTPAQVADALAVVERLAPRTTAEAP